MTLKRFGERGKAVGLRDMVVRRIADRHMRDQDDDVVVLPIIVHPMKDDPRHASNTNAHMSRSWLNDWYRALGIEDVEAVHGIQFYDSAILIDMYVRNSKGEFYVIENGTKSRKPFRNLDLGSRRIRIDIVDDDE